MNRNRIVLAGVCLIALTTSLARSQTAPAGRGGGPPVQGAEEDIPLVARFDRDADKVLNYEERTAAREYLKAHPELRRPVTGRRITRTGSPGIKLTDADVKQYPASTPLYEPSALRTLFIDFERPDWEDELEAFWHTDVEVGATLRVDGKTYGEVGISFRGNNSFTAVPPGLKRPLSVTMDFRTDQDLLGQKSLNLLNANQDPAFLRTAFYLDISRDYIPTPKANFVRVVINGENWGVYVNQQTFSKELLREQYQTGDGTRWKSPNNSLGGGISYLGDSIPLYRRWYEIKGKDDTVAWRKLIQVTRVLKETPPERLEQALAPIMDVDAVLKYLALDITLVNNDGYWRDGSDFNLYLDQQGRISLLSHDVNEGFRAGGRAGGGAQPDPLTVLDDTNKALRHKLLAVPSLRTRYLAYVGDIAEKWLDWQRLGPLVEQYRALIADDVARDTRKLDATDAFTTGIYGPGDGTPPSATTIKGFAELRRAALLSHPDVMKARGK